MDQRVNFHIDLQRAEAIFKGLRVRGNVNTGSVQCWVPRSQCEHISKGPPFADGSRDATVTLPGWLARDKNLNWEE